MPRYRINVEYDGGPFCGWQMQANGPSIQGALTRAIKSLSAEEVAVFGAGRTDAGVHALGQVAHFDLSRQWETDKICAGLNFHLKPDPIAILGVKEVDDGFHARFSASMRHYCYKIITRRAPLTIERGLAWRVNSNLDAPVMHEAGRSLIGRHDFTTFRSAHCQSNSPVKSINSVDVTRLREHISIKISARSFLHNQVRSIAGSLKMVGEGRWTVSDFNAALKACERSKCAPVAPPGGLYLVQVDYD